MPRCILTGLSALLTACGVMAPLQETEQLTVLTYNIHHGEGTDGVVDLERIAALIRDQDPDLVALQEVDRGTARTGGVDQAEWLARATGMHVVFGPNLDHQGGDYGNAILSRRPVDRFENLAIRTRNGDEPRGVLAAHVGRLTFFSTHFQPRSEDAPRVEERELVRGLLLNAPMAPMILAGDLNADPDSAAMREFFKDWVSASQARLHPSFPAEAPERQLDYVLVRPTDLWRVLDYRVIEEHVASDHRPVVAVLEYKGRG